MRPSTRSTLKPSASRARSDCAGPSSSIETGSPLLVRPAGRTRPGKPAVLPGAMLRVTVVWNGTDLPRTLIGIGKVVQRTEPCAGPTTSIRRARRLEHAIRFQRDECIQVLRRFAAREQCGSVTLGGDVPLRHRRDRVSRAQLEQRRGRSRLRTGDGSGEVLERAAPHRRAVAACEQALTALTTLATETPSAATRRFAPACKLAARACNSSRLDALERAEANSTRPAA